jgi:hypothetical protein
METRRYCCSVGPLRPPDTSQDLSVGDDLAGMRRKLLEDGPLLGREPHLLSLAGDAAVSKIDQDRPASTLGWPPCA